MDDAVIGERASRPHAEGQVEEHAFSATVLPCNLLTISKRARYGL